MASQQDNVSVRQMIRSDLDRIVEIHLESFPGFFLTFLGHDFLSLLYKGRQDDPEGIVWVVENDDRIEGFVAGDCIKLDSMDAYGKNKWVSAKAVLGIVYSYSEAGDFQCE